MAPDEQLHDEHSNLLGSALRKRSFINRSSEDEASSIVDSHVTRDEKALAHSSIGERLPYNDYTTIDWLHDLVKHEHGRFVMNRC